ncbi:MAG: PepSY domain-containing protein [Alteromonadaceae bacterium]|nr:PepSY domain-containing protein [Alteromonadaceae bacterium]
MKTTSIALGLSMLLLSGAALADDDCDDPVSGWQPRENLRQQLEADGWKVYRIKVDDGCYEVEGRNQFGSRVEASFAPSTFELMELEREDDDDHERDDDDERRDYRANDDRQKPMPSNGIVKGRPSVTVE